MIVQAFALTASWAMEEPVKIGLIAPITGVMAPLGKEVATAAKLAVQQANARGANLLLVIRDDGGSSGMASALADQLLSSERVHAIVGPASPNAIAAILKDSTQYNVPIFTLAIPPRTPGRSIPPAILRLGTTDGHLLLAANDFMKNKLNATSIAAIGLQSILMDDINLKSVLPNLARNGQVEPEKEGPFPLHQILGFGKIDAVIASDRQRAATTIIASVRQETKRPIVFIAPRGLAAFNGVVDDNVFTVSIDEDVSGGKNKFYDDFAKLSDGIKPDLGLGARVFSAIQIIEQATRGGASPDRLLENVRTNSYQTLLGKIKLGQGAACSPLPLVIHKLDSNRTIALRTVGTACSCGEKGCCSECCDDKELDCKDQNQCRSE